MGAMNEFKVLDPNGHTRTTWDTANPADVETARRIYNDLVRRGFRAFRMDERGREGVPKRGFDPKDKETLLVPPIRAG
jgi:hypothetical protein